MATQRANVLPLSTLGDGEVGSHANLQQPRDQSVGDETSMEVPLAIHTARRAVLNELPRPPISHEGAGATEGGGTVKRAHEAAPRTFSRSHSPNRDQDDDEYSDLDTGSDATAGPPPPAFTGTGMFERFPYRGGESTRGSSMRSKGSGSVTHSPSNVSTLASPISNGGGNECSHSFRLFSTFSRMPLISRRAHSMYSNSGIGARRPDRDRGGHRVGAFAEETDEKMSVSVAGRSLSTSLAAGERGSSVFHLGDSSSPTSVGWYGNSPQPSAPSLSATLNNFSMTFNAGHFPYFYGNASVFGHGGGGYGIIGGSYINIGGYAGYTNPFSDLPTAMNVLRTHLALTAEQVLVCDNSQHPLDIRRGRGIGKGGFANVFVGVNVVSGELVAIKEILIADGNNRTELRAVEKEFALLKSLHHPNIVRYNLFDNSASQKKCCIVMELALAGSTLSLLHRFGPLTENTLRHFTRDILHGIGFIHKEGILHRDIKPANILVSHTGLVKLCDFGGSKRINELNKAASCIIGTPVYMAPEFIRGNATHKADIWSIGCTLFELATGRLPWYHSGVRDNLPLMFYITTTSETPLVLPQDEALDFSNNFLDFLDRCFTRNPENRPDAAELLRHPWVLEVSHTDDKECRKDIEEVVTLLSMDLCTTVAAPVSSCGGVEESSIVTRNFDNRLMTATVGTSHTESPETTVMITSPAASVKGEQHSVTTSPEHSVLHDNWSYCVTPPGGATGGFILPSLVPPMPLQQCLRINDDGDLEFATIEEEGNSVKSIDFGPRQSRGVSLVTDDFHSFHTTTNSALGEPLRGASAPLAAHVSRCSRDSIHRTPSDFHRGDGGGARTPSILVGQASPLRNLSPPLTSSRPPSTTVELLQQPPAQGLPIASSGPPHGNPRGCLGSCSTLLHSSTAMDDLVRPVSRDSGSQTGDAEAKQRKPPSASTPLSASRADATKSILTQGHAGRRTSHLPVSRSGGEDASCDDHGESLGDAGQAARAIPAIPFAKGADGLLHMSLSVTVANFGDRTVESTSPREEEVSTPQRGAPTITPVRPSSKDPDAHTSRGGGSGMSGDREDPHGRSVNVPSPLPRRIGEADASYSHNAQLQSSFSSRSPRKVSVSLQIDPSDVQCRIIDRRPSFVISMSENIKEQLATQISELAQNGAVVVGMGCHTSTSSAPAGGSAVSSHQPHGVQAMNNLNSTGSRANSSVYQPEAVDEGYLQAPSLQSILVQPLQQQQQQNLVFIHNNSHILIASSGPSPMYHQPHSSTSQLLSPSMSGALAGQPQAYAAHAAKRNSGQSGSMSSTAPLSPQQQLSPIPYTQQQQLQLPASTPLYSPTSGVSAVSFPTSTRNAYVMSLENTPPITFGVSVSSPLLGGSGSGGNSGERGSRRGSGSYRTTVSSQHTQQHHLLQQQHRAVAIPSLSFSPVGQTVLGSPGLIAPAVASLSAPRRGNRPLNQSTRNSSNLFSSTSGASGVAGGIGRTSGDGFKRGPPQAEPSRHRSQPRSNNHYLLHYPVGERHQRGFQRSDAEGFELSSDAGAGGGGNSKAAAVAEIPRAAGEVDLRPKPLSRFEERFFGSKMSVPLEDDKSGAGTHDGVDEELVRLTGARRQQKESDELHSGALSMTSASITPLSIAATTMTCGTPGKECSPESQSSGSLTVPERLLQAGPAGEGRGRPSAARDTPGSVDDDHGERSNSHSPLGADEKSPGTRSPSWSPGAVLAAAAEASKFTFSNFTGYHAPGSRASQRLQGLGQSLQERDSAFPSTDVAEGRTLSSQQPLSTEVSLAEDTRQGGGNGRTKVQISDGNRRTAVTSLELGCARPDPRGPRDAEKPTKFKKKGPYNTARSVDAVTDDGPPGQRTTLRGLHPSSTFSARSNKEASHPVSCSDEGSAVATATTDASSEALSVEPAGEKAAVTQSYGMPVFRSSYQGLDRSRLPPSGAGEASLHAAAQCCQEPGSDEGGADSRGDDSVEFGSGATGGGESLTSGSKVLVPNVAPFQRQDTTPFTFPSPSEAGPTTEATTDSAAGGAGRD